MADNKNSGLSEYEQQKKSIADEMFNDEGIKADLKYHHLFSHQDIEDSLMNKITPYGYLNPYDYIGETKEYVFITKPLLHLFGNQDSGYNTDASLNPELANSAFFVDCFNRHRDIMCQLVKGVNGDPCPFINLLINTRKSNADINDTDAREQETSSNVYGFHITYRRASVASDENQDLSMSFEEDSQLRVYTLLKIFDEYENLKYLGRVTPPTKACIKYKILHDQMSLYKFTVASDMTVLHYAKYWGVYFKNTSRNSFSEFPASGNLELNVNMKTALVEDMNPTILAEFNRLSLSYGPSEYDMANQIDDYGFPKTDFAYSPVIVPMESARLGNTVFKMIWRW